MENLPTAEIRATIVGWRRRLEADIERGGDRFE